MSSAYRFIGLGEVLEDDVMDASGQPKGYIGGAPLNVTAQVAQYGVESFMLSVLGTDERSIAAKDWIEKQGVRMDYLRVREGKELPYTRTAKDAFGNTRYVFKMDNTSIYDLNMGDLEKVEFNDRTVLHLGSVALLNDDLLALHLAACEKAKAGIITFDPNLREGLMEGDKQLERAAKLALKADIIKLGKSELLKLVPFVLKESGREDTNTHTFTFSLHLFFAANPRLKGILLSDAEKGMTFYKRSKQGNDIHARLLDNHVSIVAVDDIKDTIGAGDMAFGAFIGYLLAHTNAIRDLSASHIEKALKHASLAAAFNLSHTGALPAATLADIKALAKEKHVRHI
jgi:sugar/nucleoside kinase (ribokinase family)